MGCGNNTKHDLVKEAVRSRKKHLVEFTTSFVNKDEKETYIYARTHVCIMNGSEKSLFQGGLQVCFFSCIIFFEYYFLKTIKACPK